MVSVKLGASDTMRRTGWGTRTVRPTSSVTSRKAAEAEGTGGALCAHVSAAQDSRAAVAAEVALRASLFLAKSAALCGMEGWPGLRLFSRSQWRDRGRFTRPSPLPLPAN